jgi:hypothetical protein
VPPRRPGPVGPMPDADLVAAIRAVLAASPFHGEGHRKVLCGRPGFDNRLLSLAASSPGMAQGESLHAPMTVTIGVVRARRLLRKSPTLDSAADVSASMGDPVRCALMSGLSCGSCRWPSWVCACVPGAILGGVLEAQNLARHGLDCLDRSLSHHAVQRFLPDPPGSRPPPTTVRRDVTPPLPQRPRHAASAGRPLCASSRPR